jgi:anti-anti-sigma regulatory factor
VDDRGARLTVEIGSAGQGVQVVRAADRLSQATATALRHAAEKALVEQPDLLVLDLSRVVLVDRLGAHALPLIAAQAAVWPVTRVIVAGSAREVQRELRGRSGIGPLSWFPDLDAAIAAGSALPYPALARVPLPAQMSAAVVAPRICRPTVRG